MHGQDRDGMERERIRTDDTRDFFHLLIIITVSKRVWHIQARRFGMGLGFGLMGYQQYVLPRWAIKAGSSTTTFYRKRPLA